MAKLDGKVALITGAAAGLGEGIATAYAKYGAKLIMVDLDPRVEETAEKLRKGIRQRDHHRGGQRGRPCPDGRSRQEGRGHLRRNQRGLLQRRRVPSGSL
ncbi:SDR family NAD(P)-dependent oxidoreductase [Allofournierella massiliensis]